MKVEEVSGTPKLFCFRKALSFKGRIAHTKGQAFGRVSAPVSRVLSRWASKASSRPPTGELKLALAHAVVHLEHAGPRRLGPRRSDPSVLVFADGACADSGTSTGAVIFAGSVVECFGCRVSADQLICGRPSSPRDRSSAKRNSTR